MTTKNDIRVGVAFLLLVVICAAAIVLARRATVKSKQPVVYQVDTTTAHILFEDTWGKALPVMEEDL